jgi:hypothetical protein
MGCVCCSDDKNVSTEKISFGRAIETRKGKGKTKTHHSNGNEVTKSVSRVPTFKHNSVRDVKNSTRLTESNQLIPYEEDRIMTMKDNDIRRTSTVGNEKVVKFIDVDKYIKMIDNINSRSRPRE